MKLIKNDINENIIDIIDDLIDDDILNNNTLINIILLYGEKNVYKFFEMFIKY